MWIVCGDGVDWKARLLEIAVTICMVYKFVLVTDIIYITATCMTSYIYAFFFLVETFEELI